MGGIGRLISCLGAEIFLLADSAIAETRKLVSNEQKSGITASNDGIKNEQSHCFLSQSVCVAVARGEEGQLAAVGEEEVHSMLDFCHRGQWGGWGILQWLSKGARGIILWRGLHKCINNSHRLQLLVLAVAVLLLSAVAWSHD